MLDDPSERPPAPDKSNQAHVPTLDVRTCIVCGNPMERGESKHSCRSCCTVIDSPEAY
jgi:hypothetical protein